MRKALHIVILCTWPFLGQAQLPFGSFDEEFTTIYVEVDDGMESGYRKETITEDTEGNIWVSTNSGILRYDGFQCINFSKFLKRKFSETVKVDQERLVLADSLGQIWIGGAKGLSVYDIHEGTYNRVFLDHPKYHENFRNTVFNLIIFLDKLYVGTENGLYIIDLSTHEVVGSYNTNGEISPGRDHTDFKVQGVYPNISDTILYLQLNDGMHVINLKSNRERLITTCEIKQYEGLPKFEHSFHQGAVFGDYIIAGSWDSGITHFNIKTEEYDIFLPDPTRTKRPTPNILKSTQALNDSIIFHTGRNYGLLYYEFPERKLTMIEGSPYLDYLGLIDSYGHFWVGGSLGLYRSKRQLSQPSSKRRSLQIGEAISEGESLGYVSLENIRKIDLKEAQDDLNLYVSLTQSYDLDSVQYLYKIDNKSWKTINDNTIRLNAISGGNHSLMVRAVFDDTVFEKQLTIYRYIPWYKLWYYQALFGFVLSLLLYLLYRRKLKQELEKEKIKSDYEIKIAKLNTSALRSRMSPHFLFNTLNSIKHHALFKSKEETGEYITDFSFLIRGILEYSELDYIPLKDDVEWIQKYMDIEKRRFRTPFSVEISMDPNINLENEVIPPLLIQPFVENALWHGLLHKEGEDNKILLSYSSIESGYKVEIIDNGIGRKAAQKFKNENEDKKKSLGMKITQERINQLSKLNKYEIRFEVEDLYDQNDNPLGTRIVLLFNRK